MTTLIGQLAPGSAQLLAYIQAWSAAPIHHFEGNPLDTDLNMVDTMQSMTDDRKRHMIATQHLGRATVIERRLYEALDLPYDEVKAGLANRIGVRMWVHTRRDEYLWARNFERASFIFDALHQFNSVKSIIESRLSSWQTPLHYMADKKGLNNGFVLLGAFVRSRAALAQHAISLTEVESLAVYFSPDERFDYGVYTASQSTRVYVYGDIPKR